MNYAALKLEFSPDPLSDTTPSWVVVSRYCQAALWFSGKAKDLDSPQAGGASFTLRNDQRRFEPDYVAGAYYPNIRPMRRFRLSLIVGGVSTLQGIYYATSWQPSYPAGTDYSVVTVSCVDGFGILSNDNLPAMNPASSQSIVDVITSDLPYAYFRCGEQSGSKMAAVVGTDGTWTKMAAQGGIRASIGPSLVTGDSATSLLINGALGSSKVDTTNNFSDTNEITAEAVINPQATTSGGSNSVPIATGPVTTGPTPNFTFTWFDDGHISGQVSPVTSCASAPGTVPNLTTSHVALTWDGATLTLWCNGAVVATSNQPGTIGIPLANGSLSVGGGGGAGTTLTYIQDVAFYEHALSATRIQAHVDAALNRGRNPETVGDRIAILAANTLWGVTHIPASQLVAEPRMYAGQSSLVEITTTVAAEQPIGLFYFRGDGDPAYFDWDDTRLVTPSAIFGDAGGEIRYTAFDPQYDDQLYNQVLSGRDGGDTFEVDDAASQAEFGNTSARTYDATGLILNADTDAQRVGQTILDRFTGPAYRIDSITLNGASAGALTQILTREIGDTIRIRRRGTGGTPIDIITQILGKSKSFDPNGNLVCTWNLARGFNAATSGWRLGVSGFSELGSTTVLG